MDSYRSLNSPTDSADEANILSLSRVDTDAAGQATTGEDFTSLSGVTYSAAAFALSGATASTKSASNNFDETILGYGPDGSQTRTVDPNGTITDAFVDGMDRPTGTYVGTDDSTSDGNPWTPGVNNSSTNNMVLVENDLYDQRLAGPAAPTLSQTGSGSTGGTTEYVKITYVAAFGETLASTESSLLVHPGNTLVVAHPSSIAAATGWNIYVGSSSGTETLQNSSSYSLTTNWNDSGGLSATGSVIPINEVGDSNLTEIDRPVDGTASHDQVTLMEYNQRDQEIATKQGALMSGAVANPAGETDGANRIITFQTVDNLDEVTGTYTYAGDGVSLGDFTSWTLSGTDPSKLRSETLNSYDDQGRVYLAQQYSVSQSSGYSSSDPFLSTNYYYDHRGDLVATSLPGGQWQKSSFNGAGWDVKDSTTDGGAISGTSPSWSSAQTTANDIVLEQTDTSYDNDGDQTLVLDRQRYDNDPATSSSGQGDLTGPNGSSATASRDSYTVNWYDAADRPTDSADLGDNGAEAYTLQTLPPARDVFSQATASGSTTTLVDAGRSETSGYFIGYTIAITAGTDAGQTSTVTGYNASTGTLTFSPALTSATTTSSVYTLTPNALSSTSSSSGSTTTLVDSSLAQPTGEFVGWALTLTSGTYAGAILTVTGYNASTGTLTFAPALSGSVASGTTYTLAQPALLTHTDYNSAGDDQDTIDPRGIITYNSYDMLGEQTSTIAAYTNGTPTASTNQTTDYSFDADGDELTQTAVESSGNNQTTQYDFGVSGTIGSNLFDNDLLAETQLPDPTAGTASTIAPGASHSGQQKQGYNFQGQETTFTDQNGTTHTYTISPVGRETADSVAVYSGNPYSVNTSVLSLGYTYTDAGLPYQQTSYSGANLGGSVVNQEQDAYNGLQQLTAEYQAATGSVNTSTTPSVQYNYNLMADAQNNSKLRSTVYPNGRILDTDYSANQEPVTGISVSGTTATVTTAVADGLSTGATVTIAGASHAALNGTFTITVTSSTTFTYTFSGSAAADSSSDITETPVSLDSTISRPDGLQDQAGSPAGTILQSYTYLGLGTIVQETDGNSTALSYIAPTPTPTPTPSAPPTTIDSGGDRYTGLDRFERVVFQNWYNTSTGAQTQGDQYGYDNDSDVLFDDVVNQGSTAASYSQLYHASSTTSSDNNNAYDPLGRETTFIRGTLSASGNNTYSSAPLDTISNANINTVSGSKQTYTLDALGNWSSSATGAGTGSGTAPTLTSTSRTNNSQNELAANGSTSLTFDNDGNTLTGTSAGTVTYDAWGRMATGLGGALTYSYLPGSDRAIQSYCGITVIDSYYSTDMQVLEDDVPSSCTGGGGGGCCGGCGGCCGACAPTVQSQYVWGLAYVNEIVERDDDSSSGSLGISGSGLGERIYPEQDANFNVRTLTSSSGTVLEHIDFDDYGNSHILTSTYGTTLTNLGSDTYNWVYGFQGGRYDPVTGLYHFGWRDYSPNLGRWMEQDGGYWDGSNLYQAFDGKPASMTDPDGTKGTKPKDGSPVFTLNPQQDVAKDNIEQTVAQTNEDYTLKLGSSAECRENYSVDTTDKTKLGVEALAQGYLSLQSAVNPDPNFITIYIKYKYDAATDNGATGNTIVGSQQYFPLPGSTGAERYELTLREEWTFNKDGHTQSTCGIAVGIVVFETQFLVEIKHDNQGKQPDMITFQILKLDF